MDQIERVKKILKRQKLVSGANKKEFDERVDSLTGAQIDLLVKVFREASDAQKQKEIITRMKTD